MIRLPLILLLTLPAFLPAQDAASEDPGDAAATSGGRLSTGWLRLSGGVSLRTIDRVSLQPGSRAGSGMVPLLGANRIASVPGRVGPANAFADRRYDDGFVNIDPGTGNPLSPLPDSTWFWGYDNPSQVNGQTLTFSALGGSETRFNRQVSRGEAPGYDEDADDTSFFLQVEPFLFEAGPVRVNLQGSWSVFETSAATVSARTFSERQGLDTFQTSVTDVYETGLDFSLSPLNAPPYAGDFNGPGPLIPNTPTRRGFNRRLSGRSSLEAFNQLRDTIDIENHALSLGASVEARAGRLLLNAAAGGTLNLVDIEARHVETLSVRRNGGAPTVLKQWNERDSHNETVEGVYVQVAGGLYLTRRVSVSVIGRWDWVDEISRSFGPSRYVVDLSGYSVLGAIGIDL